MDSLQRSRGLAAQSHDCGVHRKKNANRRGVPCRPCMKPVGFLKPIHAETGFWDA